MQLLNQCFYLFLLYLHVIAEFGEDPEHDPVIWTKSGYVRGFRMLTPNLEEFFAFQGIPYAQPPIGELRFKPPVPVEPWEGVLNANYEKYECVQTGLRFNDEIRGKEDCLYLNVYTPNRTKETTLFPVLFFIQGGAFKHLSGSMVTNGPKKLIPYGIILVTSNYRLGALGFLSTGDEISPGNNGLLDQIMVMRWIKTNIEYFGGDPLKVTVMGESAGATSINAHLVSPLTKGLFSKAITHSGNILYDRCIDRNPLRMAKTLAHRLNCSTSSSEEIINCLKAKPAYDIIVTGNNMPIANLSLFLPRFTIVIDKYVLLDEPEVLFKRGKFHKVPLITGINKDEGVFFYHLLLKDIRNNETFLKEVKEENGFNQKKIWEKVKLYVINTASKSIEIALATIPAIEKKYIINSNRQTIELFQGFSKFITDAYFAVPGVHLVKLIRKFIPVYFYSMNYIGAKIGYVQLFDPDLTNISKVSHADEIRYLFDGFWSIYKETPQDSYISKQMLSLWTDFIKYGNPSPSGSAFQWKAVSSENIEYLKIEKTLTMQNNFKHHEYRFFKEELINIQRRHRL